MFENIESMPISLIEKQLVDKTPFNDITDDFVTQKTRKVVIRIIYIVVIINRIGFFKINLSDEGSSYSLLPKAR